MKRFLEAVGLVSSKKQKTEPTKEKEPEQQETKRGLRQIKKPTTEKNETADSDDEKFPEESDFDDLKYQVLHDDDEDEDYMPEENQSNSETEHMPEESEVQDAKVIIRRGKGQDKGKGKDTEYLSDDNNSNSDSDDGNVAGIDIGNQSSSPIPESPELYPETPPANLHPELIGDLEGFASDFMVNDEDIQSDGSKNSDEEVFLTPRGIIDDDIGTFDDDATPTSSSNNSRSDKNRAVQVRDRRKKINGIPISHLKWMLRQILVGSKSDLALQILCREDPNLGLQDRFLWPYPNIWKYFQEILETPEYKFKQYFIDKDNQISSDEEIKFSSDDDYHDLSSNNGEADEEEMGDDDQLGDLGDVTNFDITSPNSNSLYNFSQIHVKGPLDSDNRHDRGEHQHDESSDSDDADDLKDAMNRNVPRNYYWYFDQIPLEEYPHLYWKSKPFDHHRFSDDIELGRATNQMIKSDILRYFPKSQAYLSTYTRSLVSAETTKPIDKMWDTLRSFKNKRIFRKYATRDLQSLDQHISWVNVLQAAMLSGLSDEVILRSWQRLSDVFGVPVEEYDINTKEEPKDSSLSR